MANYISTFGKGSNFSNAELLKQYRRFLERKDQKDQEFITVDNEGNLDLIYEPGSPLYFFNKIKNMQYRLDRLFDKASTLSYGADVLSEQINAFNRNIETTIQAGHLFKAITRSDGFGQEQNNVVAQFGVGDTRINIINPSDLIDPKLGTSLKNKAAIRDRELGFITLPNSNQIEQNGIVFSKAQIVNGPETTASDYVIKYWTAGTDNKPSNMFRDSKDFFYHSVFLSREHRTSMPEDVYLTVYLQAQTATEINSISARLAQSAHTRVSKIQIKSAQELGSSWEVIYDENVAVASPRKLKKFSENENTFVMDSGVTANVRALKITFAMKNGKAIETIAQTKDSLLAEISTPSIKRYLQDLNAFDERPSRPISGVLYEFGINNISMGLSVNQSSAVTSGAIEVNGKVSSLALYYGDNVGYLETYVTADYFSGSTLVKSNFFPMPVKTDKFQELLFFDSYNLDRGSVSAITETMFPVFLETESDLEVYQGNQLLTLGTDYSISLDGGETWLGEINSFLELSGPPPEKLLIGLSEYDLKKTYSINYKISTSSKEYSLDANRSVIYSGGEVLLRPSIEYDKVRFTFVTILRGVLLTPTWVSFIGGLVKND